MNKYLLSCLLIVSFSGFSCIKISSTSSSVRSNSSVIVTTGRVDEGDMYTGEIKYIPKILDLLNLDSSSLSKDKLVTSFTKEEILDQFRQKVRDVPDGNTLYWIHVGHGADESRDKPAGLMTINEEERLTIDEIMQTIREARGGKAIEKLIAIICACHSGTIMKNVVNYKNSVFKKAVVITSASLEETKIGRFFPSLYSSIYFLNLARQRTDESVDKLAKNTNEEIGRDSTRNCRFSEEDIKQCKSISFRDDKKVFSGVMLTSNNPMSTEDCSTIKERVEISSRTNPNIEDMYNLMKYLFTNTDSFGELITPQYPNLYSYPLTLKQEEKIW